MAADELSRVCVWAYDFCLYVIYIRNFHIGVHQKPYQPYGALCTHTSPGRNQIKFKMHHKIQYVSRKRDKLINADFSALALNACALKVARASIQHICKLIQMPCCCLAFASHVCFFNAST